MITFSTLLLEWSKNDPIPEVTRMQEGLAIILMGPPAAGKTTFLQNFVLPRSKSIVVFSRDDVRLLMTKDPNAGPEKVQGKDDVFLKMKMNSYIEKRGNLVYDFSGNHEMYLVSLVGRLREHHYTVVFIHMLAPLNMALKQNQMRDRQVPEEYIKFTYQNAQRMMQIYDTLKPDNYYVIIRTDAKYRFFKYKNGKLYRRKTDHYQLLPNT